MSYLVLSHFASFKSSLLLCSDFPSHGKIWKQEDSWGFIGTMKSAEAYAGGLGFHSLG